MTSPTPGPDTYKLTAHTAGPLEVKDRPWVRPANHVRSRRRIDATMMVPWKT